LALATNFANSVGRHLILNIFLFPVSTVQLIGEYVAPNSIGAIYKSAPLNIGEVLHAALIGKVGQICTAKK
jgi:hypothetical protein